MTVDVDAPVRPIDPDQDARRVRGMHAAGRRSTVALLLTLGQPLAALAGGFMLGSWHADAPVAGAVGMALAWAGARGAMLAAAAVALLFAAPSLVQRLARRPVEPSGQRRVFDRAAKFIAAVHVSAFATLAAVTGIVAAYLGGGTPRLADVAAFAALGLVLGAITPWTEPV